MPELPEVETIRTQLESHVVGLSIYSLHVVRPDIVRGEIELIKGSSITSIRRFGKLLIIDTSAGLSMAIHLKMTGRVSLVSLDDELLPHTHVQFLLEETNGTHTRQITFSDYRRFGFIHVLSTKDVASLPFIQKLGKEPLKDLTADDFIALCGKTKRVMKTLLLDQQKIAGIGNIYASEALWLAHIDPRRSANTLTLKECQSLFDAIESVLREGIARGGASDHTYRNLLGGKGSYQDFFKVYNRAGKPCVRCGDTIQRIVQTGRSTFYCPTCQHVRE